MLGEARAGELAELRRIGERFELRTLAFLEPDLLPQRIGHDQNVGKDDRGIEPEPPHRLQGHLDRLVRRVAEIEERAGRRPHRAIFRQIASRLTHQPDRRRREARSCQGLQELSRSHFLSLMPTLLSFLNR
jgi:hypothetical protein